MKKILLGSLCGLIALTCVGCGNGQGSTIKNLSGQLNRVTNTVSSLSSSQLSVLTPNAYIANNNGYRTMPISSTNYNTPLGSQVYKLQNSADEQEYLKQNILSQAAMIKSQLTKDLKLSKNQVSALNGLVNSMSKYTSSLNNTKTDVNSSIKMIRRYNSPNNFNADQVGAHYQSLNNHMDARLCYFRNLLNTMNQVENTLECRSCLPQNQDNTYTETKKPEQQEVKTQQKENKKNIDTYRGETINNTVNNTPPQNMTYNNGYNYNNGYMNGYGYNNGYNGYGYNRGVFNPNRNTDTYQPRVRNIDTYRGYPNGYAYNGYNNGYCPNGNCTIPASSEVTEENKEEPKKTVIEHKADEEKKVISQEIKTTPKVDNSKDFHMVKQMPRKVTHSTNLVVDHIKTNKKIEKLIKG